MFALPLAFTPLDALVAASIAVVSVVGVFLFLMGLTLLLIAPQPAGKRAIRPGST